MPIGASVSMCKNLSVSKEFSLKKMRPMKRKVVFRIIEALLRSSSLLKYRLSSVEPICHHQRQTRLSARRSPHLIRKAPMVTVRRRHCRLIRNLP
jgi:hypothetical protein